MHFNEHWQMGTVSGEFATVRRDRFSPQMESRSAPTPSVEHPFGEHPSRVLFVRNINSAISDEELHELFGAYGDIRSIYSACRYRGFVIVSYWDIRDAKSAMRHLRNVRVRGRRLDIHYSIPKENPSEKELNQGTLVVFNLDKSITNADLLKTFSKFGSVKDIRETPNKVQARSLPFYVLAFRRSFVYISQSPNFNIPSRISTFTQGYHRFIEFFDVRDAERAMNALNRTEIPGNKGKKIKIEPSRPGGARKLAAYKVSRTYRPTQRTPTLSQAQAQPQQAFWYLPHPQPSTALDGPYHDTVHHHGHHQYYGYQQNMANERWLSEDPMGKHRFSGPA